MRFVTTRAAQKIRHEVLPWVVQHETLIAQPNVFLQRQKRAGVAFAHFAEGMTVRFCPTGRIC
jgi:hypothetical protein